jgi:UDPglucose 6-dehydrogenase
MQVKPKVAMIGCGKLGLPCAEVMAEHYDVIGYDTVKDPDATIPLVDSIAEAVQGRNIIFVAVPTPHHPACGGDAPIAHLPPTNFDYGIVISVLGELNQVVTDDQMIVLISTVLPGTTRTQLLQYLTRGRFVYNPYLIAMGSVKWDMVNPECIIIGTADGTLTGDAQELIDFYQPLMKNSPRINIGTWDEAEAIKIFYNTFISAKIGLVNMIQDVAEKNGNINVDVVTDALKAATQRITGPRYLTAGMGDAGACHPRDNIALRWLSQDLNLGYDLFQAIMGSRDAQALNMARRLTALAQEHNLPVVIHGKAYKPYVSYEIGSYSLLVGHYVKHTGTPVSYYDPLTGDTVPPDGPAVILLAHNPAVTYAGTGVEVTGDEFYFKFKPGSIVVDPWRSVKAIPDCRIVHYGNPKFNKPRINGALLSPVHCGSIFRKINDTFNFELDPAKPAIYIAQAKIGEVNFAEQAQPMIEQLKSKITLKSEDRIIFITQHEGIVAHGIMFRNQLRQFWPEITDDQYIYANELLSFEQALESNIIVNPYKNHLSFMSINEWINPKAINVAHDYQQKDKWFLNYNRVLRSHRCQLVSELRRQDLDQHGLVSFVPEGEFYNGFKLSPAEVLAQDINLTDEDKKYFLEFLDKPLVIDEYDITTNGPLVADHYERTILSVITETTWNRGEIFISEKTFNAIAHGHPFIVVAPAGFLKKLRELGFRTFAGVLNEHYDEIENHRDRLNSVVNEIKRLCNLDPITRGIIYGQLSSIAFENKRIFELFKNTHLQGTLFKFLQEHSN